VAVDFIQSEKGPVVLGISPRLTATYVGLHASIGCNPAGLVLALLASRIGRDPPTYERRLVNVDVQAFR
jgi:predicted ATP-grasp superfamily ATP-dependent carboligase